MKFNPTSQYIDIELGGNVARFDIGIYYEPGAEYYCIHPDTFTWLTKDREATDEEKEEFFLAMIGHIIDSESPEVYIDDKGNVRKVQLLSDKEGLIRELFVRARESRGLCMFCGCSLDGFFKIYCSNCEGGFFARNIWHMCSFGGIWLGVLITVFTLPESEMEAKEKLIIAAIALAITVIGSAVTFVWRRVYKRVYRIKKLLSNGRGFEMYSHLYK